MIYMIQAGINGPVKIGYSRSAKGVLDRKRVMQTANHLELKCKYGFPGNEKREREIQARYERFRIRGEWFSVDALKDYEKHMNILGPIFFSNKKIPAMGAE